jgi:hypothetical protein
MTWEFVVGAVGGNGNSWANGSIGGLASVGFSSVVTFSGKGGMAGRLVEIFLDSLFSAIDLAARAVIAATGKAGGTTVGEASLCDGVGSVSSRLGGKTMRATSVIFAFRRKIEKGKRVREGVGGVGGAC